MKSLKKLTAIILTITLLISSGISAFAVVDELWGVPFLAYGASLTNYQRNEILDIFGLTDNEDGVHFDSIYVNGSDLVYFLGTGNPNSNMLSSVLISHRAPGTGVEVAILTPDYITRVTATQYATAMITAGVTDALVEVAAPTAVTGEAALAGIYKAFSERGIELDEDRMAVAQEQLSLLANIANYHKDNDDFDSYALDKAVIELQSKLADHFQATGELATAEEIQAFVANVMRNNNLEDILTSEQIQRIRGFAGNFQLTDAINSQAFRDQLNNLGNRLTNMIGNLDINIDIDRGTFVSWWNNFMSWLRHLLKM